MLNGSNNTNSNGIINNNPNNVSNVNNYNDNILDIFNENILPDNLFQLDNRITEEKSNLIPIIEPTRKRIKRSNTGVYDFKHNNNTNKTQNSNINQNSDEDSDSDDLSEDSDEDSDDDYLENFSADHENAVSLPPDEPPKLLAKLQNKFLIPCQNKTSEEFKNYVYNLFELNFSGRSLIEMQYEDIEKGYEKNLIIILKIYYIFVRLDLIGRENSETIYNEKIFNRVFKMIYYMRNLITSEYKLLRTSNEETADLEDEDHLNLFRYTPQDITKNTPFQNLLIFLLHTAHTKGYRLYKEHCYEQIYYNNYPTHAWKKKCKVIDFIHKSIKKEINFKMWQNLTSSKDNTAMAAKYLMQCNDREFPTLEPSRYLFSFRDGIYDAENIKFYKYECGNIDSDKVAIKFFDIEFNKDELFSYGGDWAKIPTSDFQSILDYQKLPDDVCKTVYIMIGRCLYEVGAKDSWEVLLFIKGIAGSGKSTIGKVLQFLFPPSEVAVLSSNIERKFGLQAIYDKLLFLCFEVKHNFGLDQADLQSMISGEDVSIAIKHGTALSLPWKVPGLFCGNEIAKSWTDASGSLTRRFLILEFNKKVSKVDTRLATKLKKSIPSLLHKCNLAYRDAVNQIGSSDIWSKIPDYFKKTSKNLSKLVDPIDRFLNSGSALNITTKPDDYIPFEKFVELYGKYLKSTGEFKKLSSDESAFMNSFEKNGIAIVRDTRMYQGKQTNRSWVLGVELIEDNEITRDNNGS